MNTKYPDFWAAFLNGMPLGTLFAGVAFSILGVFLNLLLKGVKRDPMHPRTPDQWSWKFFWSDNVLRILRSTAITLIVIFFSIRFFKELTGLADGWLMAYCAVIGLCIDLAIAKIQDIRDKFSNKKVGGGE